MVAAVNQRRFTRVPVSFRVKVMAEAGIIASPMALNLSLKGVLVQTRQRLPIGTDAMVILFVMKTGVEKKILTWARVVRHDPDGLALAFTRIHGDESFQLLKSLVMALSDDPDRILHEFELGDDVPELSC